MNNRRAKGQVNPDGRSAHGSVKGRGTGWQIAHRFEAWQRESDPQGQQEDQDQDQDQDCCAETDGMGPGALRVRAADAASGRANEASPDEGRASEPVGVRTEVRLERTGRILTRNDSPDVPFDQALNPYRGCEHGCIYCYARPTHAYLGLSPGLDFETRLVAKPEAAARLRQALSRPGYRVSPINIGSATDAYQPVERRLRLTRSVLEVLAAAHHPATIVTKSAGILHDIDLLAEMACDHLVQVFISITTLAPALARILEPRAAAPARRLAVVRALATRGVPVAVNIAPIIPFINEPEIERVAEAAARAGAQSLHYTVLRLPWEVAPLFKNWLNQHFPDRSERVMARVRELHGGEDYRADFGARMKGRGLWADLIRQRIDAARERHGLARQGQSLRCDLFAPPADWKSATGQGTAPSERRGLDVATAQRAAADFQGQAAVPLQASLFD